MAPNHTLLFADQVGASAELFQRCPSDQACAQTESPGLRIDSAYTGDAFPSTMQLFLEELGLLNSTTTLETGGGLRVLVTINHALRLYYRPLIIVAGVFGNILSWLVFTQSKLRKFSCSPYLTAIALSDTVFLLVLFVVWLGGLGYNTGGWCHAITYASYTCTFLPVWLCVAMAIDRTIFVICVDSRYKYCTTLRSKLVVVGLVVVAIVVYLNVSLLSGVVTTSHGTSLCIPLPRFSRQVLMLDKMDAFVNVLVPYVTLTLISLILCRYMICCYKNKPEIAFRPIRPGRRPSSWDKTELLFTKTLVLILVLYLVFNLPSCLLRLCVMFASMHSGAYTINNHLILWQQLFMHLFFTRFACNFYLYAAVSDTFRKNLCLLTVIGTEKTQKVMQYLRQKKQRRSPHNSSSSSSSNIMSNCSTQMQVVQCSV